MKNIAEIKNADDEPSATVTDDEDDRVSNLRQTALAFGQSEEEISREFKIFKAAKLYGKVYCNLTETFDGEEFCDKIAELSKLGFGGALVLPSYTVRTRVKFDGYGGDVFVAVCFPFGEESYGVKKLAVKRAVGDGATKVLVPVGVRAIKENDFYSICKEFKKCVKINSSVKITALIDCDALTADEIQRAVKSLSSVGVKSFCAFVKSRSLSVDGEDLRLLRAAMNIGDELVAIASKEIDAVGLFRIADKVIAYDCACIVDEITKRLGIDN